MSVLDPSRSVQSLCPLLLDFGGLIIETPTENGSSRVATFGEEARHIDSTEESGRLAFGQGIEGPITMLNLLRFRTTADYSDFPALAPPEPITGREAYDTYMRHTLPFLAAAGGHLQFMGAGGHHLIGPTAERWDLVLLVRYPDLATFMSMASNRDYLAGIGHRTAALVDSRLLPMVERVDRGR